MEVVPNGDELIDRGKERPFGVVAMTCAVNTDIHGLRFPKFWGRAARAAVYLSSASGPRLLRFQMACGIDAFPPRQPKMIAQCLALQARIEVTALLQDRDHQPDEIVETLRDYREPEDETVRRILLHPVDDLVRNGFRRADETFAQRLALFLGNSLDAVSGGSETVLADVAEFRKRCVEVVAAEIVVIEEAAEIGKRIINGDQVADDWYFSSASACVSPTTGPMPGKIFTSFAARPCATAACLTRREKVWLSSSDTAWVKTASACLPASPMPASDEPAWKMTG